MFTSDRLVGSHDARRGREGLQIPERTYRMDIAPHLQPSPRPPGHLFVGNLFDVDASRPIESLMGLARKYGPIFQIELPGRGSPVIVSGYELVAELCDDARFDKMLGPGLNTLAEGPVGRGLFTSETSDPRDAMRGYYP